jgi:hypothetical protein
LLIKSCNTYSYVFTVYLYVRRILIDLDHFFDNQISLQLTSSDLILEESEINCLSAQIYWGKTTKQIKTRNRSKAPKTWFTAPVHSLSCLGGPIFSKVGQPRSWLRRFSTFWISKRRKLSNKSALTCNLRLSYPNILVWNGLRYVLIDSLFEMRKKDAFERSKITQH